ncbi:hypothetical protein GmHk_04G010478 [Glycine max]|nr:hypothetical protein JHK86_010006 [Glycine max]KAH1253935.1 hypothetical protein GmHk_04G010478 [Glycine max]
MNTSSSNASDVNVIEVPFSYHRQWSPNYPTYVLFDYRGNKHFIKLHKYGNRFFFGNGLKELRRTHGIHESFVMRFVGWDKNTTFNVDIVGPLHRQTHQWAATTIRHHVFTIDVSEDMIQHNYQLVDCGSGRHHKWMITMNNGLSCVAEAWIHYLVDCHLKPGDEVVFFYNIDQHLWEVLYRKQVKWDQEEDEADST